MLTSSYLANHLLIAMPGLSDPNFSRGVTLLCQHSAEGALGIMVNRLSNFTLGEVLEQMHIGTSVPGLAETPVYAGGPVQTDRGFVLHRPVGGWQSTLAINDDVGLTSSRDVLQAVARDGEPSQIMVTLGYSGWGAGQLENELAQNVWLTVAAEPSIIFELPYE